MQTTGKTNERTRASRSNNFDVLNFTERGLEVEEVNAVDVVQQIVEITVGGRAAKSVWPIRQKSVAGTKTTKTLSLAAANGSPIRVEGDARLEFVRDGKRCNMKFVLASVSAIVHEIVVFVPRESYTENTSTGQIIPRSCRKGVFVAQLNAQVGSRAAET